MGGGGTLKDIWFKPPFFKGEEGGKMLFLKKYFYYF